MHLEWAALGQIFLVSFGAAVGVIVLFSLGVAVLAPPAQGARGPGGDVPLGARRAIAALCFGTCVLVVGYGLYLIIAT